MRAFTASSLLFCLPPQFASSALILLNHRGPQYTKSWSLGYFPMLDLDFTQTMFAIKEPFLKRSPRSTSISLAEYLNRHRRRWQRTASNIEARMRRCNSRQFEIVALSIPASHSSPGALRGRGDREPHGRSVNSEPFGLLENLK